jgi:hypothetical protein
MDRFTGFDSANEKWEMDCDDIPLYGNSIIKTPNLRHHSEKNDQMENTTLMIDPQAIYDKNREFLRSRLKEYLDSELDDPSYDLNSLSKESKEEKLKEVAQIMRYYGPVKDQSEDLETNTGRPELRNEMIVAEDVCWKKVKRYRLCIYGNSQVLQAGDYVLMDDNQKGVVQYFTMGCVNQECVITNNPGDSLIYVHLLRVYTKSDFSPVWQTFIKMKDEFVETDKQLTVSLGRILEVLNRDKIVFSSFVLKEDCLRERSRLGTDLTLLGKILTDSYVTADTRMLAYHPLVQKAARFVSLLCRPEYFAHLILRDFLPYSMAMSNDLDDEKQYDFGDFTMLHRLGLKEDICTLCGLSLKLVFEEGENRKNTACESCYVRLRRMYYRIFQKLEPWRISSQCKKSIQENEDKEEIYDNVVQLLQTSSYSLNLSD